MSNLSKRPELPRQGEAPDEPTVIFRTYEKLETCEAVQVTRENILDIAEHFGWNVEMKEQAGGKMKPVLKRTDRNYSSEYEIGDWITKRGDRRSGLDSLWAPFGYYSAADHI